MAAPSEVINWEEAMQQVGDDEEFLRELLADLRSETETQIGAIAAIIQVRSSCRFIRVMSF
jgi:HPt (histidine-containing phosphotransfer) domain-containing protein